MERDVASERYEISLRGSARTTLQDGGQTARVNPRIIHTRALQITRPAPRTQPPPRRPRTPQTKLFIAPPPRHVFVTGNTRIFTGGQTAKPSDISRGASAMSTRSSTSLAGCAVRVCITNAPICENVLVTFRLINLQVRPTTQVRSIT